MDLNFFFHVSKKQVVSQQDNNITRGRVVVKVLSGTILYSHTDTRIKESPFFFAGLAEPN